MDAPTEALVNTVNTVGVMGKGIALQFKENFPNNYKIYAAACKRGELVPGKLLVTTEHTIAGDKTIINFPTKTEWFQKSKYEYIEKGLIALIDTINAHQIKSIAIPPLGCGNGGLVWSKVKQMMEKYLAPISDQVDIIIYEPNEAVKEMLKQQEVKKEATLTPARAMLLYSMFYYENFGEHSSLFVANKLAYFLQRLGEHSMSNLKFKAHHYGPYTVQVEHMLHNINGKYIKGLEQREAKAFDQLDLQYDRVKEIQEYVRKELTADQRAILKNLISLIEGFQSALSLEILATVDFVKKDREVLNNDDVVKLVHCWSARKKALFQEKYVDQAIAHLQKYGTHLSFS